jgi:hypothetical protein
MTDADIKKYGWTPKTVPSNSVSIEIGNNPVMISPIPLIAKKNDPTLPALPM